MLGGLLVGAGTPLPWIFGTFAAVALAGALLILAVRRSPTAEITAESRAIVAVDR